jgi:hypothetical protein
MQIVGIILVVLGALALAYHGFRSVMGAEAGEWVSPVASAIALVCGLLMLATTAEPEDET